MVQLDLNVKQLVSLTESGTLSSEELKIKLDLFEKKDLIAFVVESVSSSASSLDDDNSEELF